MKTRTIIVDGVQFVVQYEYHSTLAGSHEHGSGIQLEPDEPSFVEISDLRTPDCLFGLLPEETIDCVSEAIRQSIERID